MFFDIIREGINYFDDLGGELPPSGIVGRQFLFSGNNPGHQTGAMPELQ